MTPETFASGRRERLTVADDAIRPAVQSGLARMHAGEADWFDKIVETAGQVWLEHYQAENPGGNFQTALARFRASLMDSLEKTRETTNVERVTRWASTLAVNSGTVTGASSAHIGFKMWVTMEDSKVRDLHMGMNGKIVPMGSTFEVAGSKLPYPGAPVGPPEVWIECRCVAMPAARKGETMSANTFEMGPEDPAEDNPNIVVGQEITADAALAEPEVAVEEPDDMPTDELEEGEEEITEIPIHGVLAPEGVETGDRRGFRDGALSTRPLPIPFRTEVLGSHGGNQTSEVVTIGRIDEAWRDEASKMWRFKGAIVLNNSHSFHAIDEIVNGTGRGVSIDADDLVMDLSERIDEHGEMIEADFNREAVERGATTWYKSARVAGLTKVPIPAFHQAYVGLGHEFEEDMSDEQLAAAAKILEDCGCDEKAAYESAIAEDPDLAVPFQVSQGGTFAPGTHDGPGWITHPVPTQRIRNYWVKGKGAAKIGWGTPGDFNRCRAQLAKYVQNPEWLAGMCANMHKEAIKIWPPQHAGKGRHALVASGALPAEPVRLVASAANTYSASAFTEPADEGHAYAMRIDREARTIQGYAAQWGSCHIGIQGMCREAPHSRTDYSFFRKGVVQTDAGEQNVGLITYGIGHASEHARAAAATAHYDQPDAVRAYINIGENVYGIWYAGVLAPWVTDEDIDAMLAIRRVSGDWRNWSGRANDLEMVGLVVVNTEGFQLAASGGIQTAAVGIGAVEPEEALRASGETHEDFTERVAERAAQIIRTQDAIAAARGKIHAFRVAEARRRLAERI